MDNRKELEFRENSMEDVEFTVTWSLSCVEWINFYDVILECKNISMVFESLVKEFEKLPNELKVEIVRNSLYDSEVITALYDHYFEENDDDDSL